jgi:hypothetical protein
MLAWSMRALRGLALVAAVALPVGGCRAVILSREPTAIGAPKR